jgi:hypothetical protein
MRVDLHRIWHAQRELGTIFSKTIAISLLIIPLELNGKDSSERKTKDVQVLYETKK